jgi:hypothetical protein
MSIFGTTYYTSETTSSDVFVKLLQFHKVNDFVKLHAAKTSGGGGADAWLNAF